MQAPVQHIIHGETLWLSGERAIFWENTGTLIVSDCHFGKTGHFRKSGIAVPQKVFRTDMQRLLHLVQHFGVRRVIVTGDFFHSEENSELAFFRKWRNDIHQVEIILVKGNHDILEAERYTEAGITVHDPVYTDGKFMFCHDPEAATQTGETACVFTGHIHPGIRINGAGRQSLLLPCFYFSPAVCIMPAFSHFTGLVSMRRNARDRVFAIVEQKVVEL